MSKKLTGWFKPNTTPVREGVYETDSEVADDEPCFQHWNGGFLGLLQRVPGNGKTKRAFAVALSTTDMARPREEAMTFLSRHAQGIAYALFILAAYIAAEQIGGPSETDSLKAVADIDASLASMYAASRNESASLAKE